MSRRKTTLNAEHAEHAERSDDPVREQLISRRRLLGKVENYPANSIASEPGDVEIHEQTDMAAGESQIRYDNS